MTDWSGEIEFGGSAGMQKDQKDQRKEEIIAAAGKMFAEKGYAGTLMADIAGAAGIGKGTVYEYFRSKEALFLAVFDWYMKTSREAASISISVLTLESAADRLQALGNAMIDFVQAFNEMYSLAFEFWAASASGSPQMKARFWKVFRETYQVFRDIIAAIIRDGIDRGEFRPDIHPESVASAVIGVWDGLGLQYWFDNEFDLRQTVDDFWDLLMKGALVSTTE